jgi:anaerobic magnesium-protoporphyrin IX monomethyl ester cyclase
VVTQAAMRVLLIDFNPFSQLVTPISLGYIGAALKARGHEVRVLALSAASLFSASSFKSFVGEFSPRLVGFATYQRNIFHVRSLTSLVKEAAPHCSIMLGGPQATFLPEAALDALPAVDYLCRGEGEVVVLALAEALRGGDMAEALPGATRRSPGGGYLTGPTVAPPADLDEYPSPWLTGLLDPAATGESIMLTSRGCPYGCAFCYTPAAFGRSIRTHSVERVIEEIAFVSARGSGRLWFADPNFSFRQERVVAILEGVARRGVKAEMWIETRADMLDGELLRLLKHAGVYLVAMGLESASENVYPHLDKQVDPDTVRHASEMALAAGLDVELFSQYALPYERLEDAMATLRFVREAGIKIQGNSNAQQMQIYFGSQINNEPLRFGIKPLRSRFAPYHSIGTEFETEWMSKSEIDQVRQAWLAASLDGGKRVVS